MNRSVPDRVFITGTGTGVGKTWVTRGLAAAAVRDGRRVAALKPYETGCPTDASGALTAPDASALARAAGRPDLASPEGLYRALPPLAPWAATLAGTVPPPSPKDLAAELEARSRDADLTLVEGAGGLLVPVDEKRDVADLAVVLGAPVIIVARDGLGVLSHTLTAVESSSRRGLEVLAIVLTPSPGLEPSAQNRPDDSGTDDPSLAHNRTILAARLDAPVLAIGRTTDDDGALADAVIEAGLYALVSG